MRSRLLSIMLFLVAFSPAIWMTGYMRDNAVDSGCWDEWEVGPLLKKWHEGTLTWTDLYAPTIQHRIVIPRLLMIGLTYLGDGDFRPQLYFALGLALTSSLLLFVLLRRALGETLWVHGIWFAANLLIFSPMHFQTLFWPSGMWMCIPIPCLLGALVILSSQWALWLRVLLAVVLTLMATHSFSQGVFIWPVVVAYIALQPRLGTVKQRLVCAGAVAVVMAVTLGCYFHNFYNTAYHAYNLMPGDHSMKGGVKLSEPGNLPRVIHFFLGLFGALFARNPFSGHLVDDAGALGVFVVLPFILVAAFFVVTKRGRDQWGRALPLLAAAGYAMGVAFVVAAGRAHMGEHRCVLPRYFVVTQYVPIVTLGLGLLAARTGLLGTALAQRWGELLKRAGVAVLAVFSTFQWHLYQHGMHLAQVWNNGRRSGQAITLFINHPEIRPWSYAALDMDVARWNIENTRDTVNTMKKIGFTSPAVLDTPELKHFKKEAKPFGPEKAALEKVTRDGEEITVVGNARFGSERPADLILFTAPGSDTIVATGVPTPQAMLRLFPLDYEFNNPHDVPVGEPYRFEARFPASVLEKAGGKLDIWLLDREPMRITKMKQQVELEPAA